MRKTILAALALATGLSALAAQAAPAAPGPAAGALVAVTSVSGQVVDGEYIVTTRPGAATADRLGIVTRQTYHHATTGFAARLSQAQLAAVRRDRDVLTIEPNQVATALSVQTPTPNWGLDRIDQRLLPLNNTYNYFANGTGVTAYVIDTGITPALAEFGGRAAVAYDALGGNGLDCNGHGTHLAGIIGSATYGVSKRIALRGVRVLNCQGSGTYADVIEGIDWVRSNSPGPSVALIALGGGLSAALNNAVTNLWNSGVFVAVSAGSSASNACNYSPAGATGAFAVAATDRADQGTSFNNFGPCVKLCAPGVLITSVLHNGTLASWSGTSMAAAHVAGVAGMYKSRYGEQTSATVAAWLVSVATPISNVRCTPGRLLHTNLI
jgi:subtilisin family serine protease